MRVLFALLIALVPVAASAGWINKSGERLPEADYRKAAGDFGAQLVFVSDERELFRTWAVPSESVEVKDIDAVAVNKPINAFVVFSGCAASSTGKCDVSMRFRVLAPDGTVYADTPPMEVWYDKPAPPPRMLELSVQYLKVIVEPHEQRGRYTVEAQVRDKTSGKVLNLKKAFNAAEAK